MATINVGSRTANALIYDHGIQMIVPFPIASAVVIKAGQLAVKDSTNPTATQYVLKASSGQDTYSSLVGVFVEDHYGTDGSGTIMVDVSPMTIWRVQAAADANGYAIGQPMQFASAGGLAKSAGDTSTNDIFVVCENNKNTTATTIKVKMRFGKSFFEQSEDA